MAILDAVRDYVLAYRIARTRRRCARLPDRSLRHRFRRRHDCRSRPAIPAALKNDADKRFFHAALDQAAAIALGRVTHEQERNSGHRRLVLTRRVAALAPDPADLHAMLWNPAGASWDAARLALGLRSGTLAVIGGTDVYQVFLDIGYDAFRPFVVDAGAHP